MAEDQVKPDSGEVVLNDVEVAVEFRVCSLKLTNYPDCPHCDLDQAGYEQKE